VAIGFLVPENEATEEDKDDARWLEQQKAYLVGCTIAYGLDEEPPTEMTFEELEKIKQKVESKYGRKCSLFYGSSYS
jgi:leucyl aminopeptidase